MDIHVIIRNGSLEYGKFYLHLEMQLFKPPMIFRFLWFVWYFCDSNVNQALKYFYKIISQFLDKYLRA